uniref:Uncharacterized protein n=1 Tax=Meleagris gallopavo TaxID=9103 RepID=A0A803Y875_MELGA
MDVAMVMTSATSPIILKWDPKSLEIRTLTVERLLEPLVTQVNIKLLSSLGQSAEIVVWCTYFSVLQFIISSWLCNYPSKMGCPII